MIALLLALQALPALQAAAPAATAPMPSALGRQPMPKQGCAAFLWSVSDRKLIAVADASAGTLRIALAGKPVDYARVAQSGLGALGFAATTRYAADQVAFGLDMSVTTNTDLTDGGLVPQGVLSIERAGSDALLIPVAGVVGCASAR